MEKINFHCPENQFSQAGIRFLFKKVATPEFQKLQQSSE